MNIEEIKKRLAYLPRELKDGGFSDNSLTFGARLDIEYLLSIIEEAEKTLKLIANGNNEFPSWGDTVDILKDVRSIARETLKAIQGDE